MQFLYPVANNSNHFWAFCWKSGQSSKFCPILGITEIVTDLNRDEAIFFSIKKNNKMADTKDWNFQLRQFSNFFAKYLELKEVKISVFSVGHFKLFLLHPSVTIYLCDSKTGTKFWFPAKSSEMIAIVSHCNKHNIGKGLGVSLFDF